MATDLDAFSRFRRDALMGLPHVKDMHTSFSLGEVKSGGALPLSHRGGRRTRGAMNARLQALGDVLLGSERRLRIQRALPARPAP